MPLFAVTVSWPVTVYGTVLVVAKSAEEAKASAPGVLRELRHEDGPGICEVAIEAWENLRDSSGVNPGPIMDDLVDAVDADKVTIDEAEEEVE